MKRSGRFSEPPDSEKLKSCCPHPLPENQLLLMLHAALRTKARAGQGCASDAILAACDEPLAKGLRLSPLGRTETRGRE